MNKRKYWITSVSCIGIGLGMCLAMILFFLLYYVYMDISANEYLESQNKEDSIKLNKYIYTEFYDPISNINFEAYEVFLKLKEEDKTDLQRESQTKYYKIDLDKDYDLLMSYIDSESYDIFLKPIVERESSSDKKVFYCGNYSPNKDSGILINKEGDNIVQGWGAKMQ